MSKRKQSQTRKRKPGRRSRRKKGSLMGALIIEVLSIVALFMWFNYAQEVREARQPSQPAAETLMDIAATDRAPIFRMPAVFANFELADAR